MYLGILMLKQYSTGSTYNNRPFYSCVPSDLAFEWK